MQRRPFSRKKGNWPEKASASVLSLIKDLGLEEAFRLEEIKAAWDGVFNDPLKSHMSPSHFSNGSLLINVDSPAWLQQLQFLKGEILKKLSPYKVKEVRFKVGSVRGQTTGKHAEVPARPRPLTKEETELADSLISRSGIEDEELKGIVRRTIEQSFQAKRVSER